MLPFGVTILATVPQGSEIPEGLMNNPVLYTYILYTYFWSTLYMHSSVNGFPEDGLLRPKHVVGASQNT
jgi:hypothetical protein